MLSPKRIFNAASYSIKGFKSAWQTEAAFRDNVVLVFVFQAVCIYARPESALWLFCVACNALLIICELFNTGLEYLADHASLDQHDLLGRAKDVGSAAVMTALLLNLAAFGCVVSQLFS